MDKAAAIENDETMIINNDHSIITTPVVEFPEGDVGGNSKGQHMGDADETATPDVCDVAGEKSKRYRPKARSESNRSEKYANSCLIGC